MWITICGANHPDSEQWPTSLAVIKSWSLLFDGPVDGHRVARKMADSFLPDFRHVRVFVGKGLGKLWMEAIQDKSVK